MTSENQLIMLLEMLLIWVLRVFICESKYGSKELSRGAELAWTFPNPTTIQFDLYVPSYFLENFGWIGVGFLDMNSNSNLSDLSLIKFFEFEVEDRYSVSYTYPTEDSENGGSDNIDSSEQLSSNLVKWTKPAKTQDSLDVNYTQNNIYELWLVYGFTGAYGIQDIQEENQSKYKLELTLDTKGSIKRFEDIKLGKIDPEETELESELNEEKINTENSLKPEQAVESGEETAQEVEEQLSPEEVISEDQIQQEQVSSATYLVTTCLLYFL